MSWGPESSELDYLLESLFPRGAAKEAALQDWLEPNVEQTVARAYAGGPQEQRDGLAGTWAQSVFGNIDRSKCPSWMTGECLELISRMLEQTFRNFQLHARRPSHIDPPFSAKIIDAFPATATVSVAGGGYGTGTYTDVATFVVPEGHRGEIVGAGQAAESAAAFQDLSWRLMLDDRSGIAPYQDVRMQLWTMAPPSPLYIHLHENQQVKLQVASLSATAHTVIGRLFGWVYPVRSELGDIIQSTITD